jgi:hypothetical protein
MAGQYTPGKQYFKNRDTGSVYSYRDSLSKLGHLDLYVADDDGNLMRTTGRQPDELNPTKTPEKKTESKTAKPATATKSPTMQPVENK